MVFKESETVELKSVVVDDIKKEIIAFTNCEGGKLYIGVQDDGTPLLYCKKRGCVRKGFMSGRGIPQYRRLIRQSAG